jgi:hypothetical protein
VTDTSVDVPPARVPRIVRDLEAEFYVDERSVARSVVVRLGEDQPRDVFVKSAEDTVLRKLLLFRLGGGASYRQWSDVRGVAGVQAGQLDVACLTRWAERLEIRD